MLLNSKKKKQGISQCRSRRYQPGETA